MLVVTTVFAVAAVAAAFGTGFHGSYVAPSVPYGVPVLAVDIPSGLGADLGEASDNATKHTKSSGGRRSPADFAFCVDADLHRGRGAHSSAHHQLG